MAKTFDPSTISKEQKARVLTLIRTRIELGLNHTELDYVRDMINRAIQQQYSYNEVPIRQGSLTSDDAVNSEILAIQEQELQDSDEFSNLRVPLLYKVNRGFVTAIKNGVFPSSDDWIEVKREEHPHFDELGIHDFLPYANEGWVQILKTENKNFQFKSKYSSGIAEFVAYGTTGNLHYYNDEYSYVDVRFPGIANFGIYPLSDRWRESTLIVQYDINYHDLKTRQDFDQAAIEAIRPAQGQYSDSDPLYNGRATERRLSNYNVPADKVRLYDLYFPTLYIPADGVNEEILLEKVYLTVALGARTSKNYQEKSNKDGVINDTDFILKASTDVERYEAGINLANFGETLPGVFYHKGPLIPFISDQMQLNQIKSGISRIVAMLCDPPLALKKLDGDFEQTFPDRLEPGATYEGYEVTSLAPPEYSLALQQFREYYKYVNEEVEEASGMTRTQLGMPLQSRRSATEVREFSGGNAASVDDPSSIFDDEILRPSIMNRIQLTQKILMQQVEGKLEHEMALDPTLYQMTETGEKAPRPEAYDACLKQNALFKRLKAYSGIDHKYKEFKKMTDKKLLEDEAIMNEIESMIGELQGLIQFANSPIQPILPTPEMAVQAVASGGSLAQMMQQYYQSEQEKRMQAKQEAKMLTLQIKAKKIELNDTQPVPEPSDYLYYEILTADIDDSDISVTGSMAGLSKEMALKAITTILEAGAKIPQIAAELDFDSMLTGLAKASGLSAHEVKKSISDKAKEEEQQKQQMAIQQQMLAMGQPPPEQPQG